MTQETSTPLQPKPCVRCGSPGELVKTGSRRYWVQCSRFSNYGSCQAIGPQADNKKQAILNWNATR